jgi:hypothetical protein
MGNSGERACRVIAHAFNTTELVIKPMARCKHHDLTQERTNQQQISHHVQERDSQAASISLNGFPSDPPGIMPILDSSDSNHYLDSNISDVNEAADLGSDFLAISHSLRCGVVGQESSLLSQSTYSEETSADVRSRLVGRAGVQQARKQCDASYRRGQETSDKPSCLNQGAKDRPLDDSSVVGAVSCRLDRVSESTITAAMEGCLDYLVRRSEMSRSKQLRADMKDDESVLANEEGKKLSNKQQRQLRNKVSTRAFRSRTKGGHLGSRTMYGLTIPIA